MQTFLPLIISRYVLLRGAFMLVFSVWAMVGFAQVRYVRPTSVGAGNGSSWANASGDLQAMINASASGDEVWVAAGTYMPTQDPFGSSSPTDPRDKTFYLKNEVKLYGGFAGTETLLSQRNITTNTTTLSGDIGTASVATDNSYHVVLSVSDAATTVLDGFTVSGGNANGSTSITVESQAISRRGGGGMNIQNSSPILSNVTFSVNNAPTRGGAIFNGTNSIPQLTNCIFKDNSVSGANYGDGGAIYNIGSSPIILNCSFINNSASGSFGSFGGAIRNSTGSSPQVTNCLFQGNSASGATTQYSFGGAISNENNSNPTFTNCAFLNNSASGAAPNYGGAISTSLNSTPILRNCSFQNNSVSGGSSNLGGAIFGPAQLTNSILFGNGGSNTLNGSGITASYSLFDNTVTGYTGSNNLTTTTSPFVSTSSMALANCSPAIDAGDDAANTTTTDLGGNPRKLDAITGGSLIDMGAYEFQSIFTTWYTDADGDNYGTGTGQQFCSNPGSGWAQTGGDCNDAVAAINPGAAEVCDGVDNDCDLSIDEGAVCPTGSISGASTVNCFGDFTVKLTAMASGGVGPYTYLWSTGQSGNVLNNAGAGTYTCTITDQNGKTFVASHIITQPAAVSATLVVTGVKCLDPNKGSIVVTGAGGTPGYTYALNFGTFGASNTFSTLNAGQYTVNIKDANGCEGKLTTVVRQLASSMTLSAVRTGVSACGATNGSITATAGAGVAPYEYKLGAGSYQSSGTFTGLAPGTYSITAKDNIGCTITRSYTVTDNGKDAYESNNAINAAKIISLNTNVVARIGTATDQDWFKFNTGSAGDFDITLSHGTVNYNLQLFTNLGALITPVSQTGNTISYTGLEFASTYRIQITGAQSFVCYNLMVAPAPPVSSGAEMLTSTTVAPEELKAQAFPNPHNGSFILQVESPVSGKGSVVLYDLQGRTMVTREENLRAGTNQVRFSNLQPENYFYRVMVGGKSTSGKVFKQ